MHDHLTPPPEVQAMLAGAPGGPAWLAGVGDLARQVAVDWGLELGAVLPGGMVSLVVEATTRAGIEVVLKLQYPHRECEHEAAALARWDGDGAVRLLDHDVARHALLLERCRPGTRLSEANDVDTVGVLIELLDRLLVPGDAPFTPVGDEAARWIATLADERGRHFDAELTDLAIEWLHDLVATPGPTFLVHQDLHGDNVLAATRAPWLAIDPKPLRADRELAAAPVVRSCELGHSRAAVIDRLDRVSAGLGLDRERARRWAVAQTIAWTSTSSISATHLETVGWLLEA